MAQETNSEASVASSSPIPNWWEIHTNPIASWNTMNNNQYNTSTNCEDQDHMSNISTTSFITNVSNHSMDASSADLPGEPSETRLWNQVLFGVGNVGADLHNNGPNFPEVLSSRNVNKNEVFNSSPCDYLKKIDNNWDYPNSNYSSNNNYDATMMEQEPSRLTNWSIAPPSTACNNNISLNPSMQQIKYEIPSYVQDHIGATLEPNPLLSGLIGSNYQVGLNNSLIGINNSKFGGLDAPWSNNARNLSDLISFGNSLSKPGMEHHANSNRPPLKRPEISSSTKGSGRIGGANDGKKKKSEDNSDTLFKKSKLESSSTSTIKLQPPKVKLGDKITALQQIVSPFGKTDTASVLLEAINCIRILQEQVQLLSDPYLRTNMNKDHTSWGTNNVERKDKGETKNNELRSKGLCLVPISCTPQIYRENSGPDYWPPTYRGGCLYR